MDDKLSVKEADAGLVIEGPFRPEYKLILGGYHVPYITAQPAGDDKYFLTVDGRIGMADPVSKAEIDNWINIVANAMAVAAGYPCFGTDLPKTNPFNVRMSCLAIIPEKPDLKLVQDKES